MAYVSKELKDRLVANLKPIAKKYGLRMTYKVCHHSQFVITIRESKNELMFAEAVGGQMNNINHKKFPEGSNEANFVAEVMEVINAENHDNSDIMTDYFDVGFYFEMSVGEWNKPYIGKVS